MIKSLVQAEFDFLLSSSDTQSNNNNQPTNKTKKEYTITDKTRKAWANQIKTFELSPVNNQYIESFRSAKYPKWETDKKQKSSWLQYKSSIGSFLEIVKKDAVIVKNQDLTDFISKYDNEKTKANKIAHIKSFLTHLVKHNVANCNTRISREVLIMIVSM